MAGRCSICVHPERDIIETDLVSGATTRDIAGRFAVSRSAVSRHRGAHLPIEVTTAAVTRDIERGQALSDRLEELYGRAEAILEQAEAAGRHNVALAGIKELRGILEFAAKLAGGSPRSRSRSSSRFTTGLRSARFLASMRSPDARRVAARRAQIVRVSVGQRAKFPQHKQLDPTSPATRRRLIVESSVTRDSCPSLCQAN